ncbi:MAG: pyridoxamine 5'-phosphate oxidase [Marinilabiliales bacterium]|nr:MAG: pyridoxamine 5'-phosphate oxidase [Marinilabiliales bacterium]
MDLFEERREYTGIHMDIETVPTLPLDLFSEWMSEILDFGVSDPSAAVLSTCSEQKVSSRVVLIKQFNEEGFVFFTNYLSKKSKDIHLNPNASLLFFWPSCNKQVRVEGSVKKTSEELSDQYFSRRPLNSRLAAIFSQQSENIESMDFIKDKILDFKKTIEIERPDNWGGYVITPELFEFWQGHENRLHDRIQYQKSGKKWEISRLAP